MFTVFLEFFLTAVTTFKLYTVRVLCIEKWIVITLMVWNNSHFGFFFPNFNHLSDLGCFKKQKDKH